MKNLFIAWKGNKLCLDLSNLRALEWLGGVQAELSYSEGRDQVSLKSASLRLVSSFFLCVFGCKARSNSLLGRGGRGRESFSPSENSWCSETGAGGVRDCGAQASGFSQQVNLWRYVILFGTVAFLALLPLFLSLLRFVLGL